LPFSATATALPDNAFLVRDGKSGFASSTAGRASRRVPNRAAAVHLRLRRFYRPQLRRVEAAAARRSHRFLPRQDADLTGARRQYLLVPCERAGAELAYSNNEASVRIRLTWPAGRRRRRG
jgi:hypothetical protein